MHFVFVLSLCSFRTNYSTGIVTSSPSCNATQHLVFAKTHKAGSSTIVVLLQRYGIANNKAFAVPSNQFSTYKESHTFDTRELFNAKMAMGYTESPSWNGFDYLLNHARFNRPEMNKVVKNALYVTILRDPFAQLESAFEFFGIARFMTKWTKDPLYERSPFQLFLSNPHFFYSELQKNPRTRQLLDWIWNGQMFDMGLDPSQLGTNSDYMNKSINRLTKELDLVLIMDYFDESLMLLRKRLCIEYQDLVYPMPILARSNSSRVKIDPVLRQQIASWNSGDVLLYEHFNRTFWTRIEEYGPDMMTQDLAFFRELKRNVSLECESKGTSTTIPSMNCKGFTRKSDPQNTEIIRRRQLKRH